MKKVLVSSFALLIILKSYSQEFGETKIVVTVSDTTNIYEKVEFAFKNMDFKIADSSNRDTLVSKPRAIYYPSGFATVRATITGNTVTFEGWYGTMQLGIMELYRRNGLNSNRYKQIIYFKNSSTWRLLRRVADGLKKE